MRFLLGYGSCGIASGAKNVLKGLESAFENTLSIIADNLNNGLCKAKSVTANLFDNEISIFKGAFKTLENIFGT